MSLCIMLTAVEASGDALGAGLMRALKARLGQHVRFIGLGGPAMAAEGLVSAFDIAELSVFGLVDGAMAAWRATRRARELAELAVRERADVAVLIDSWGFSHLLAKALRRRLPALPLVKYVAPQVWATRPARAKAVGKAFDRLLCIVAFEVPIFEAAGAKVTFVGHPGASHDFTAADPARLRAAMGAGAEAPILLVLPGSRASEIDRMLPVFGEAARLLKAERPFLQVAVVAAPTVAGIVRARVAGWPFPTFVVEGQAEKDDAMAAATVALACSGSVTTELAAAGAPMVVGYRVGPVTHAIIKRIVRTRFATLFNIAADAMIAPELLQYDCTGARLAQELALLLDDAGLRRRQVQAQGEALLKLGRVDGQPADRAAAAVLDVLNSKSA